MEASSPCFRLDGGAHLIQILLCDDGIIQFRTINVLIFFASVALIPLGVNYGIYLLIVSYPITDALFNSNPLFLTAIILFWVVFPFISVMIPILLGLRKISSMKSNEELAKFLAGRAGNVVIRWDDIETASLENNRVLLNLKNDRFRRGFLKQVYYSNKSSELPKSHSGSTLPLDLLQELLRRKLGDGFEISK